MCLKTLEQVGPCTRDGRAYDAGTIDYFWSQVEARMGGLPVNHQPAVAGRRPSPELRKAVMTLVDRAAVFTATGRLRARAAFAARHNNVFQGLAADGAELALWRIWRAGLRIANFIHDEPLIEVPAGPGLARYVRIVLKAMVGAMKEVVPDVRVAVESVASTVWSKEAKDVHDDRGRLIAWSPPEVPLTPGPAMPAIAEGGKLPPGEKRRGIA
jgi:hypothetical protein